jgi:hypothetical protein
MQIQVSRGLRKRLRRGPAKAMLRHGGDDFVQERAKRDVMVAVATEAEAFLERVVPFPAVPGKGSEPLLRVMDRLCAELGGADEPAGEMCPGAPFGPTNRIPGVLDPEEEALVSSIRGCLAKLAAAATGPGRGEGEDAVCVALDGAELVIRGELARGRAAQLAPLVPSFVFLVTLPVLDQDEALEMSRRASELIEEELED